MKQGATMQLEQPLDRLANFHATTNPVISLYLDGRPDQQGRETWSVFVRKELATRIRSWADRSAERDSFHRDVDRILAWLHDQAHPSADGYAIFACAGAGEFFEAVALDAPIEGHRLFVEASPHIFPLVCVSQKYRPHAVAALDRHTARLFVFGAGARGHVGDIEGDKVRRSDAGGWSQARFQRRVDNLALHHVKEVIAALDDLVRSEGLARVVLAAEEQLVPVVRDHLPRPLAERVVETIGLDAGAGEVELRERAFAAIRAVDARQDAELVARVLDAQRAGGLGAAGMEDVFGALAAGQVHELLVGASPDALPVVGGRSGEDMADELVTMARRTSARVVVIEDPALLAPVGGVAARLRYRLGGKAA